MQHEKERAEARLERSREEVSRLNVDLREEHAARTALEHVVAMLTKQAAQRHERMAKLLALGERLPGTEEEEECGGLLTDDGDVRSCYSSDSILG